VKSFIGKNSIIDGKRVKTLRKEKKRGGLFWDLFVQEEGAARDEKVWFPKRERRVGWGRSGEKVEIPIMGKKKKRDT